MTKRLEAVFAEVAKLPNEEQETLATIILEELASERRWAEAFTKSQEQLTRLAEEALAEFRAGQTAPLETDQP